MRKKAFKSIVGSHNYNLNDENSDKDYKIFLFPTFDDIYKNKKINKHTEEAGDDIDHYDIRELPRLLYKSNINFTETLFSVEKEVFTNDGAGYIKEIFDMREDIARINLSYLFDACMGMFNNKVRAMNRDDAQALRCGYDGKSAMTAYRILDFLIRYADGHFESFEESIRYNSVERERMLRIKNGDVKIGDIINELSYMEKDIIQVQYKDKYKGREVDTETFNKLSELVKKSVIANLEFDKG